MPREETENLVRDILIRILAERIGDPGTTCGEGKSASFTLKASIGVGTCRAEGILEYTLPDGLSLSHRSDIQIELAGGKYLALELKHLSAVTDQFKTRSYDMLHLKRMLGDKVCGIMIYLHVPGGGIGIERARAICYPFDHFWGIEVRDPTDIKAWVPAIVERIEAQLQIEKNTRKGGQI